MKKFYKICYFQHFFKYVKKYDKYEDSKNIDYIITTFNTREDADKWIKCKENNIFEYGNPNGCHYEKIAPNTFKLTYSNTKTYRILSYQICEFFDI